MFLRWGRWRGGRRWGLGFVWGGWGLGFCDGGGVMGKFLNTGFGDWRSLVGNVCWVCAVY